jgi:DNA repair exonuclease SbcCD nuclease subunit
MITEGLAVCQAARMTLDTAGLTERRTSARSMCREDDTSTMRIIHTSDIHLDACFAGSGFPAGFGARRRQSLRDVFQAIMRRAVDWPADAILIAGDLFDQDRVTRDTVAFLRAQFRAASPVPIFIAPGNHDPYTPDSPYATEDWPDNVTIFSNPSWTAWPLEGPPLTVHGFAFDGPDISVNPFGTLRVPDDGRIHVAVAHGSEQNSIPQGKDAYAPFAARDAAVHGLKYLALGHFHAMKQIAGDFPTRVFYSGAPEGHGFGEIGPHYYLAVEIDRGQLHVLPVPSCRAVYAAHTVDCSSFTTAHEVVEAVRGLCSEGGLPQIARVTLAGTATSAFRHEIPAIRDAVENSFEFLDLVDATEAEDDYAGLARENTSLGSFVARLNEELADTAGASRRRMLERARQVGVGACRGQALPIRGMEKE